VLHGTRTRPRRACCVAALLAVASAGARVAGADEPSVVTHCPVPEGGTTELGRIDPAARLSFVRETLDDQARRARTWSLTWGISYTAIAVGSAAVAPAVQSSDRRASILISGLPAIVVPALLVIDPLKVMHDQKELEDLLDEVHTTTGAMDPCILVARAEWYLVRDAEDERGKTGILQHGLNLAGSLIVGLAVGLAVGDWVGAALNFVGGTALGEIALYTEPTGAVDALRRYRAGEVPAAGPSAGAALALTITPRPAGVMIAW
jgi:hypothetical protein